MPSAPRAWTVALLIAPLSLGAHGLDAGNTQLTLEVRRFGLPWLSAQFHELRGEFTPTRQGGRLQVIVSTESIDCRDGAWNERLRSPQWLDTQRFPQMRYQSSGIEVTGSSATVHGQLTLHGVTRPLTLRITDLQCRAAAAHEPLACTFLGRGELRRSEFGLPHGFWQGGDAVQVLVRGVDR